MTDDEALDIAAMVIRTAPSGHDIMGPLVQAGYRAGLEEVTEELERLLDLPDEVRDSAMDIYDLKRWLDAKLKEQA